MKIQFNEHKHEKTVGPNQGKEAEAKAKNAYQVQ